MTNKINRKLLFLCTGNYYRSRFSEHLFNALAQEKELNWQADSRGLAIERGINNIQVISPYADRGLRRRGLRVPINERFPCQAINEDFETAYKIIALDECEHRPLIETRFSKWINEVEYWEIHDIDRTFPTIAMEQMERRISKLIQVLEMIEY
ncbi:Protein tyrosine phosphatase [Beggiatoa sp. PS]|nr:Protein tyrosine phosphatase [Beggiatoa sp. PS]